jgi:A118 family predicted phage portal protein|nr:MAG TPA: portal protein [Caudoviricetes sp.]
MDGFIESFLSGKGYAVNKNALSVIRKCDNWYANRVIREFHKRCTVQGEEYEMSRLGFAKRCCSDDANLCEVLEINAGANEEQQKFVKDVLDKNQFETLYREQLEKTSAAGTVACYVRIEKADLYEDGTVKGGIIKLNYVDAECFYPLTVDNKIVVEAAFVGEDLVKSRKQTTLVMFLVENGTYTSETHVFNENGEEKKELAVTARMGDVKPFAVMRNAEVNNIDNMIGYGKPKIWDNIPYFKALDILFNVLYGDLDKADKLLLINDIIIKYDQDGNPITPSEQARKIFVMLKEKLPDQKDLIQEYNPTIRVEEITKTFELVLSLLSMGFGYGTKKYSFNNNGQITTATEFVLSRQDALQELNRQRKEAISYIQDICRAVMWFANTFLGKSFNLEQEIKVDFDDSIITDKESELERLRNDALSFDIPEVLEWYLAEAYNLTPEEAKKLVSVREEKKDDNVDLESED